MASNLLILLNFLFFFAPPTDTVPASIYDFKVPALNGSTIDFSAFKGKKILIVNTPTNADYKPQYAELDALYKKYQDKLVIVAFLDDDFEKRPGSKGRESNRERHYNVTYPIATKVLVRTDDMAPIYKWLTQKQYNKFEESEVKWDFQKYLINEKGELVAIFDPNVRATDAEIISAIEKK